MSQDNSVDATSGNLNDGLAPVVNEIYHGPLLSMWIIIIAIYLLIK